MRAVKAGIDVILDSPDSAAAAAAIVAAVKAGDIPRAQIEQSARRILEAKARLGLHRVRTVNLDAVPLTVGGRKHDAVARTVSERSITLIKDARNSVPLPTPKTGSVLYLSVLDYPSGWRIAAPSRTVIPALKARWPNTEAVEISDRTTPSELDLVRAMADNYDAIVAGVFVRASSGSGRLDLAPQVVRLLQDLSRGSERRSQPFVAMFFGNPYTPMFVPEMPAMLLTYDFSDYAEESAVRALAGEIAIAGKLPIALPGLFPIGHGLTRPSTRYALVRISLRAGALSLPRRRPFPTPAALMQSPHDRGIRRRHIVALAEILADVEQHDARGAVDEQLPVAVAHRALVQAGRCRRARTACASPAVAPGASSGSRSMPSSFASGGHGRARGGEDRRA